MAYLKYKTKPFSRTSTFGSMTAIVTNTLGSMTAMVTSTFGSMTAMVTSTFGSMAPIVLWRWGSLFQKWVQNGFPQQHTICHVFHFGARTRCIIKPDTVSNLHDNNTGVDHSLLASSCSRVGSWIPDVLSFKLMWVSHQVTKTNSHLLCNPLCHCHGSNPPGLNTNQHKDNEQDWCSARPS